MQFFYLLIYFSIFCCSWESSMAASNSQVRAQNRSSKDCSIRSFAKCMWMDDRINAGQTTCQLFTLARAFKRPVCLLIAVKSVLWNFTLSCFRTELSVLPISAELDWIAESQCFKTCCYLLFSWKNNVKYKLSLVRDPKIMLPRPNFKMRDRKKTPIMPILISSGVQLRVPWQNQAFLDLGELPMPCSNWLAKLLIMVWTASNFCSLLSILPM